MIDINKYSREKSCVYRGEEYLVRDNGAILRKSIPERRKRAYDNEWTFGKVNANGYLAIASVPIHRIVATAFHGNPPTEEYVVDHIDTNKQNNRPDNLRWVTRFENVVLNEISRKKIEYITGVTIFEFLANPAQYSDKFTAQNYNWMRTVTQDEADACLQKLKAFCKRGNNAKGNKSTKMGEWIFGTSAEAHDESDVIDALTPTAKQIEWRTPSEFPCCPLTITDDPLQQYYNNLSTGKVFNANQYGQAIIIKFAFVEGKFILVMVGLSGQSQVKNYALAKITFEDGYYLHTSLGTFFTKVGAEKEFTLMQGLEWMDGDTLDDFC